MSKETNPDALPDAPPPRVGRYPVNGTTLYAEVRGSGPPVLLIGAADEDAEIYRPIAERLTGFTVVTYDRRGTGRSGREGWPSGGAAQHADDAAGLLTTLGLDGVTVLGASAGGIVALALCLRHPKVVRRGLIYEPGLFRYAPGGEELRRQVIAAVDRHLAAHPGDWLGAVGVMGGAIATTIDPASPSLFTPPEGMEWYTERTDAYAESLIRGDFDLTGELVDESDLASCPVDLRFAYGTASLPIFREIATRLAAVRGAVPDAIDGVGHGSFFSPDEMAAYIRAQAADPAGGPQ